jgi:hypothetical protein
MRLAEAQSRELLRTHGVYVSEACDGCGNILGPVRYTKQGEKGEWCSQLCRDGIERKTGVCRNSGTPLNGNPALCVPVAYLSRHEAVRSCLGKGPWDWPHVASEAHSQI